MEVENQMIGNQHLNENCETLKNVSVLACEVEEKNEIAIAVVEQIQENGIVENKVAEDKELDNEKPSVVNQVDEKSMSVENISEAECLVADKAVETITAEVEQPNIDEKVIVKLVEEPQKRMIIEQNEENEKSDLEARPVDGNLQENIEITEDVKVEGEETEEIIISNKEEELEVLQEEIVCKIPQEEVEIEERKLDLVQDSNDTELVEEETLIEENVCTLIAVEEVQTVRDTVEECAEDAVAEAKSDHDAEEILKEPIIVAVIEKEEQSDVVIPEEKQQGEIEDHLQVCVEDQQNDEIEPKQLVVVVPEVKHEEPEQEPENENEPSLENGLALPPFVMEALEEIAVNAGFLPGYTFELQPGSNYGDGFVAIMVGVTIHGKKNKNFKIVDDKLVLLCKVPPTSQIRRKEFGSMLLFEREVFLYKELLPYFVKFQLEKGIKQHEGFFAFAKCYYASYDETKEESVIIMEDLRERGFTMCDKTKTASYFEIRKLMITLGRLHAISLALKDQQPELFEKFKVTDKFDMFTSEKLQPLLEMMCDQALTALGDHEEFKREKIEKLKPIIGKTLANCITSPEAEPYAVVNHGDCWINNMMYTGKSDSLHGEICMIDFQVSRYASPVLDLVYFLFTCTDSEMRLQHFDDFIQIYHKSLSAHLERLGGDTTRQFPMSALLNQLKKFGKFGICVAILMIPMLCTANSDLPDVDKITEDMFKDVKTMEPMINEKSSDKYKNRMSGVIRDTIRLGYL